MLRVEGYSVGYGDTQVLWDVSVEVGDGEFVALIGVNGAGKTTPTPPPAEASLAERNRVLDEELRRQARLNETLQLQLLAIADGQRRPEPTPPDTPPSREDNPDAYNEWLVNKRVSEEVSKRLDPSVKAYTEDRKVVLSTAVEMAKFQVATKYPDLWKEVGEDVEKFISNFPPDVLARPGAIEEALWREVGIRATKKHLDDSGRSAAGGVGRGLSVRALIARVLLSRPAASESATSEG